MSRARALLEGSTTAPGFRSVASTIGGEVVWIRLRSPSAAMTLLLDAAAYTISAALAPPEDPAPAHDTSGDGSEVDHAAEERRTLAQRRARKHATIANLDETIDRYCAECVVGIADPRDDGTSPDPCDPSKWDAQEWVDLEKRERPGRPWARRLPIAVRRDVYVAVLGWIRGVAGEVPASTATFRSAEQ